MKGSYFGTVVYECGEMGRMLAGRKAIGGLEDVKYQMGERFWIGC